MCNLLQEKVHVDLHQKIHRISFATLPPAVFPPQETTNKLASLATKLRKRTGIDRNTFPYFEVADFMPDWAGLRKGKGLDFTGWKAAFEDFALAAAAAGMWDYTSAYTHLRICTQIAVEARQEGKDWTLARSYDELARKSWNERMLRGEKLCS